MAVRFRLVQSGSEQKPFWVKVWKDRFWSWSSLAYSVLSISHVYSHREARGINCTYQLINYRHIFVVKGFLKIDPSEIQLEKTTRTQLLWVEHTTPTPWRRGNFQYVITAGRINTTWSKQTAARTACHRPVVWGEPSTRHTASGVMSSSLCSGHLRGSRPFCKINRAHRGGLTRVNPVSAVFGWIISPFCTHFFPRGLQVSEHTDNSLGSFVFPLSSPKWKNVSPPTLWLMLSNK